MLVRAGLSCPVDEKHSWKELQLCVEGFSSTCESNLPKNMCTSWAVGLA